MIDEYATQHLKGRRQTGKTTWLVDRPFDEWGKGSLYDKHIGVCGPHAGMSVRLKEALRSYNTMAHIHIIAGSFHDMGKVLDMILVDEYQLFEDEDKMNIDMIIAQCSALGTKIFATSTIGEE